LDQWMARPLRVGVSEIWFFSMEATSDTTKHRKTAFLETTRLIFRTWAETDLELAHGLWGDPRVTRLIDAREKLSIDKVRERLAQEIASEKAYGVQYWPIFLRSTGEHIGCCGLRAYDLSHNIYDSLVKWKWEMGSEYQEEVKQKIYLFLRQNSPCPAEASF
jgi:ribosomal-protein-alanine N-acetyltransferase